MKFHFRWSGKMMIGRSGKEASKWIRNRACATANAYLKLSTCIEFLQAVHSLLAVYHRCNSFTLVDPRMFQCFGGRNTLEWIDGEHLIDEIFRLRCYCIPFRWWILYDSIQHTNRIIIQYKSGLHELIRKNTQHRTRNL